MKQLLFLCAALVALGTAGATYKVNYLVQEAEARVSKLVRAIDKERETLGVLGAEWAYLNRPERLRALAETYYLELRLSSIAASDFVRLEDLGPPNLSYDTDSTLQQIAARLD